MRGPAFCFHRQRDQRRSTPTPPALESLQASPKTVFSDFPEWLNRFEPRRHT